MRHADKALEVRKLDSPQAGRFERIVLPHLGAGFTLAMYLTRNTADAEDAVQEADRASSVLYRLWHGSSRDRRDFD